MGQGDEAEIEATMVRKLGELRRLLQDYRRQTGRPFQFPGKLAAELKGPEFPGARVFSNRRNMVRAFVSGGTGAEVGVEFGRFSRVLLDEIAPEALHLFDLSFARVDGHVTADPRVTVWEGDSAANLAQLPDASLDWIYIDGDHSYRGCLRDAEIAEDKLRPGGIAFFNDYATWSPPDATRLGVVAVVNELVNSGRWGFRGIALAWHGFHDVALEKLG